MQHPPEAQAVKIGDAYDARKFDVWAVGILAYLIVGQMHPFMHGGFFDIIAENPPLPSEYPHVASLVSELLKVSSTYESSGYPVSLILWRVLIMVVLHVLHSLCV